MSHTYVCPTYATTSFVHLFVQASRKIRPNRNFEGLSAEAAKRLGSYFHFRNPESIEVGEEKTRKCYCCRTAIIDIVALPWNMPVADVAANNIVVVVLVLGVVTALFALLSPVPNSR